MYSYTNNSWFPSIQHPYNLTRFGCCKADIIPISFTNSRFPCFDFGESCLTAIIVPSKSIPCKKNMHFQVCTRGFPISFCYQLERYMQNIQKKKKKVKKKEKEERKIWNPGYLVDGSKTTFANLICKIEVVSGCPDLLKGKETGLQIQSFQSCQNSKLKMFDWIFKNS